MASCLIIRFEQLQRVLWLDDNAFLSLALVLALATPSCNPCVTANVNLVVKHVDKEHNSAQSSILRHLKRHS
ncbi:hypothetical protein K474DRAFT_1666673 [Panus rudis PR-1116 ss-1]|nr:hypothetical protein K474DRAFT_1666673 [Panus rudis PR-1116 ss-1]